MIHKIGETSVGYKFNAKVLSVYDGDGTFWLDVETKVDIGFDETITSNRKKPARMYGIDTPEIRHSNDAHRRAGLIVKDYVEELILGETVVIHSIAYKSGKFGRILIDIEIDGKLLSTLLLDRGYALPYFGGSKKDLWGMGEIDNILGVSK